MKQFIKFKIPDYLSPKINERLYDWFKAIEGDIALLTISEKGMIQITLTQDMIDKLNIVEKKHTNTLSTLMNSLDWDWRGHSDYTQPLTFVDIWELKRIGKL